MAFETIVAMNITDPGLFQKYRARMKPILENYGGGFRYDFLVQETLQSEAPHPINRVFAIFYKDRAARDAFFANPDYQNIRRAYLEPAIQGRTVIAEYER